MVLTEYELVHKLGRGEKSRGIFLLVTYSSVLIVFMIIHLWDQIPVPINR